MSNQVLTPAENTIELVGVLKSKDLKEKVSAKHEPYISGHVVIATSPVSEYRVSFYAGKYVTRNGERVENGLYNSLVRVNTWTSVADLMGAGTSAGQAYDQAAKVSVYRGRIDRNERYDASGFVSRMELTGSSLNAVAPDVYQPCARFTISGYIERKTDEMVNDSPTGRVLLTLLVPNYRGAVKPMEFVTTPEAGKYVSRRYEVGQTVRVYGQLVNTVTTAEERVQGFMGEEIKRTTTRVNEYLIDNGIPEPWEEESAEGYSRAAIQEAMRIRETEYIPSLKCQYEERAAQSNSYTRGSMPSFVNPEGGYPAASPAGHFSMNDL